MPSAKTYVREYRAKFGRKPGVWGSFTSDSARILFAAINRAKSYGFAAVERELRRTTGYRGAMGTITINAKTGYRSHCAGEHPPRRQPQAFRDHEVAPAGRGSSVSGSTPSHTTWLGFWLGLAVSCWQFLSASSQ
jgi:hypothetical protein